MIFEKYSWVKCPKACKKETIKRFYLQLHYKLMNLQFKSLLLINFHASELKFIVLIRSSKPDVIKTHKCCKRTNTGVDLRCDFCFKSTGSC